VLAQIIVVKFAALEAHMCLMKCGPGLVLMAKIHLATVLVIPMHGSARVVDTSGNVLLTSGVIARALERIPDGSAVAVDAAISPAHRDLLEDQSL